MTRLNTARWLLAASLAAVTTVGAVDTYACSGCPAGAVQTDTNGEGSWGSFLGGGAVCSGTGMIYTGYDSQFQDNYIIEDLAGDTNYCMDAEAADGNNNPLSGCFIECDYNATGCSEGWVLSAACNTAAAVLYHCVNCTG